MFGIGLPEMIVILVVALIVVGPEKLPELAKSLAKGVLEMKKTVNQLKENLSEEDQALNQVQQELRKTADDLKERMLDTETNTWGPKSLENTPENKDEDLIEVPAEDLRPWEEDALKEPEPETAEVVEDQTTGTEAGDSTEEEKTETR